MRSIHVKSLPFKDVIREISEAFHTNFSEKCEEYYLGIPEEFGEGIIRGINFSNGLGIIIYDCVFTEETEIRFTKNDIHPVKYLYTAEGELNHRFADEEEEHQLNKYECAIVSSQGHKGHVINFKANEKTYVLSLEIDRKRFFSKLECELTELSEKLKSLFLDTNASNSFYHKGYYSIAFDQLMASLNDHDGEMMVRKLFLEGKALEIFIKQIILFDDDLKSESTKSLLRKSELFTIRESANYINENLEKNITIKDLARDFGLNPNKLQAGFKFLFRLTVNEYIMQQRMLKASTLLKTTDHSLSQIAEAISISSKSYFSKSFKKHFGVLPSEYLNKN
ncbi:AraC-like DNA-binding protein [Mesonia algae]|uniref:AraC-like DNA-binding protein n=1 Tax=Mesonia algae TaxID=213248 RepID=A0A2W7I3I0_9FLAO|nr:AraC family transcriptional regulator [Mesonia algae]PZW40759.1 AraC-like DNA-binding protein [Mesonia algae]